MHPTNGKQGVLKSIQAALRGWPHAMTERNFRLLLICGLIALVLLGIFSVPAENWIVVIILIALTLVAEIFNTAIEEIADALIQEHHPGIAKAKELTAGGVFILSLLTLAITLYYIWQAAL